MNFQNSSTMSEKELLELEFKVILANMSFNHQGGGNSLLVSDGDVNCESFQKQYKPEAAPDCLQKVHI